MDQEVEEVSFLPGEVILNKKAVYEPTKGQRFRQIVCSRGWAIGILLLMAVVMIAIAVIAAFARPASQLCQEPFHLSGIDSSSASTTDTEVATYKDPQTYIAANGEPFPWKNLRLPRSLIPEAYSIFLHANLTESHFIGNIHMSLRVAQDTDFIVFHTKDLNISNVKVFVSQTNNSGLNFNDEVTVLKELQYPRNEQYYLSLATHLQESTFVQVQVDFRGSLEGLSNMRGFYKSSYTVNGQERYIASTHFEANAARLAFPCFDEPDLKATVTMSIVRDQSHITLFNTPLKRTAPHHGNLVVDEYEETVKMSTYLIAFIICDFKNMSTETRDGVLVRIFAPEDKISMGKMALDATVNLLEFYSTFFGTPYPLPKQDLVAIPNFAAGAMENWGLITFRESNLLYDPEVSTASARETVVSTVAHELAHQWFGNLVTMKWWDDLWLNEGFATYVESDIGTNFVDKSFRKRDLVLMQYLNAMTEDSLMSSHPIAATVNDPVEIDSIFDQISYDKGSAIIHMLKNFLTEEPFKKGLSNYLQKHKFGNAETHNLWEAFQEVSSLPSHLTVSKIMDTWTKQMGLPVVTVLKQDGKLHLSQKRFLLSEHSHETGITDKSSQNPFGYKWIIPFTYKTASDPNKQSLVWLSDEQDHIQLNGNSFKWIKANVDTQGFYRVNYGKDLWQEIIQQLHENHTIFSVADRMGLIEDAFSLARVGLTDYQTVLDLTKYLVNETDYFVWATALSHFSFLRSRLYLEEEYDQLMNYTLLLVKSHVDTVNWDKQNNPIDEFMQSLMINTGISLEYYKLLDKALQLFQDWKNDLPLTVSNGLRFTIYSQGVKHGSKDDWDLVFQRYTKEVVPSEQHSLLKALANTRDARLLQLLLKYGFNDTKVKSQDSSGVMTSIGGTYTGQLFAWRYLREQYPIILDRFGSTSFIMSNIISGIVSGFNTQFDYDEIVSFFKNKSLGTAKLTLDQSLEYVQSHIIWTKNHMAIVKTWLQEVAKL